MNATTIVMDKAAALQKLEQYETAVKENPRAMRAQDRPIMEGYRLLAKGRRLLDVNDAIKAGGLNLAGLPKLAIARAHVVETKWEHTVGWRFDSGKNERFLTGGGTFFYAPNGLWRTRITDDRVKWIVPAGTFEPRTSDKTVAAMAPLIPLPLRPKFKLENYFLLWEANWHPAPPVDPYLLRPIVGSLMEIIAEWDVSALELAAVRAGMTTAR